MHFAKLILFTFCVAYYATHCSTGLNFNLYRMGEACFEEHLKEKGKLNETFESKSWSPFNCDMEVRTTFRTLLTYLRDEVKEIFPTQSNVTKCLIEEFANREAADHILKISVIESNRFLSVSEKDTMMEEARNQFKDELKEIAEHCLVDGNDFIKIYHDHLGIKNETMVAYQHQYCMAKYVVDHQIIQLNNVDTNPHRIETDSVNCDYLLYVERGRVEEDLTNKLIATQAEQRQIDCILNGFKANNMFGYKIAMDVLYFYFDVPSDVKEDGANKVLNKRVEYGVQIKRC